MLFSVILIYNSRNSQYFQRFGFLYGMSASTTVEILSTSKGRILPKGVYSSTTVEILSTSKGEHRSDEWDESTTVEILSTSKG